MWYGSRQGARALLAGPNSACRRNAGKPPRNAWQDQARPAEGPGVLLARPERFARALECPLDSEPKTARYTIVEMP